eukprot:1140850-Pelagomonas_calceolata.AAC.2
MDKVAQVLAFYARHRASDPKYASPFAYAAFQVGADCWQERARSDEDAKLSDCVSKNTVPLSRGVQDRIQASQRFWLLCMPAKALYGPSSQSSLLQADLAYMGGKLDDITVVVARVASIEEVNEGARLGPLDASMGLLLVANAC